MTLESELRQLANEAAEALKSTPHAAELARLRARLDEPLRVAIAGRIKAGKSTLLNALVGEQLAPTDAGECTKIVTWYRFGEAYQVHAELTDGREIALPFSRPEGKLAFSIDGIAAESIVRLHVSWPSTRLRNLTLIDTPGLDSANRDVSQRTERALADQESVAEADAVIYLMRHVHESDIGFLEAFLDDEAAELTPVNSVAVLSRADEIGGGKPGAMESARRIAARYSRDARMRALASVVEPVSGLLAETAATVQEREAEALRMLARHDAAEVERMLFSVDLFREVSAGPLTVELREELLRRFGLPGVRNAVAAFRAGEWTTGTTLARWLRQESGIEALNEVLHQRFGARAKQLVARTVLTGLQRLLIDANAAGTQDAAWLLRRVEEVEAASFELGELRLLDLVWRGATVLDETERADIERVTGEGTPRERCGLPDGATPEQTKAAILEGVARWRQRAADPRSDRVTATCCETMARAYERMYVSL